MKKLFLASHANIVIPYFTKELPKGLKIAFVTTPAEIYEGPKQWLEDDRKALLEAGFMISEDYTFTKKTAEEIQQFLKNFDGIFISGGNTFYALEKIQQSECADVIRDFVNNGKIYIGSSAGSVLAGPDIYPVLKIDSLEAAPNLNGYKGLGLTDVVILPHWGRDGKHKDLYLNHRLEHVYNEKHKLVLMTDNQYLKVEDDKYQIIDVTNA